MPTRREKINNDSFKSFLKTFKLICKIQNKILKETGQKSYVKRRKRGTKVYY